MTQGKVNMPGTGKSASSHSERPKRGGLRDRMYAMGETLSVGLTSMERPGRFARIFFKFPVWLDRVGLSRLMGNSLVFLTTTGRKSGLPRKTALSNFGHDADTGAYYVVAGFGPRSDWCRNARANPRVHVKVGRADFDGVAEEMSEDFTLNLVRDYVQRYPSVARSWSRRSGVQLDGSEDSIRRLAAGITAFALRPSDRT